MATRFPLEYEIKPKSVPAGMRWLTLRLKNIGTEPLTGLDVRLNSLDAYSISVYGTSSYIAVLSLGEEQLIPFQVAANGTTSVYATVDGWQDGDTFHWETPGMLVIVGEEAAELVSLFAMTEPYPAQPIPRCLQCVQASDPLTSPVPTKARKNSTANSAAISQSQPSRTSSATPPISGRIETRRSGSISAQEISCSANCWGSPRSNAIAQSLPLPNAQALP